MSEPTWVAGTVEIRTRDGCRLVDGFTSDAVPGLAVTPTMSSGLWAVTHIASGRGVGPCAESEGMAKRAAIRYCAAGDWTRQAHDLWADEEFVTTSSLIFADLTHDGMYVWVTRPIDDQIPAHIRERIEARRA